MKTVDDVADYIRNKKTNTSQVRHGASDFTVELSDIEVDDEFRYAMLINPVNNVGCITVYINTERRNLYLASYYYSKSKGECVPSGKKDIPHHEDIFSFLKQLSVLLDFSVALTDDSTKTFAPCDINYYIFSLAGKPTFYEKFGFHNAEYTKFIKKTRKRTIKSVLGKKFDFKVLDGSLLTKKSKMGEVADFIYTNCRHPSSQSDKANDILKAIGAANKKDGIFKNHRFTLRGGKRTRKPSVETGREVRHERMRRVRDRLRDLPPRR